MVYAIEREYIVAQVCTDLHDMCVVANRYSLLLWGNIQKLRITSWDAVPRIDKTINYAWQPGVWYRLKLTVQLKGDVAVAKGKCWKRGEPEPADWMLEVTDSRPNREGS